MNKEAFKALTEEELRAYADDMAGLLVESWDALAAVVTRTHFRLYNISPSLVTRIKDVIEPWNTGEP